MPAPIETDAVIIGAGPVGLFQVFELGLLEIRAHVIDSLPGPGGQPAELYPDKPIYDIPGIPVCTGRQLVNALLQQIAPFAPTFHFGQTVTRVHVRPDGRFEVGTSQGTEFVCRALFIAAGVGAFEPRRLRVDGLAAFEGSQLTYRMDDAAALRGQQVLIVGDGDSALDAAITLAEASTDRAASITLLHRRDAFTATPDRVARMRALCATGRMQFRVGQITGCTTAEGHLRAVQVAAPDGNIDAMPLDRLLVLQGLSPKLGPIAEWGLPMERKQLPVNTETFCTATPGIFAVGDINTYPGKKKLILSGFHECALAAFGAVPFVFPGQGSAALEYTTSSSRLHKLLGVTPPAAD
ncbi:MAG: NAD(P)/FAD-dependent oxidoreductase [Betaproteobacteria bacterium]|nr:NAD(P)/FAD-dependent oxidoreductase [Betaproteobacteria bacterium]